ERSERMVAAVSRETKSSNGSGNGGAEDAMRLAERRLLTLRLGRRHLQTLGLLFCAPGIRVADLADLLGVQLPSMDRYLSELERYGLVRRDGREALSEDVVCITSADMSRARDDAVDVRQVSHLSFGADTTVRLSADGQRLVAMTQGIGARSRLVRRAVRSKARRGTGLDGNARWNSDEGAGSEREEEGESRRRHAAHDAGVFHFFALLARAAANENRQHSGEDLRYYAHAHRMNWWEVGSLAERRYRYRGSWHNLRPDGVGLYQAGRTRFRFWLEWDQGSMNRANLTRKFATYATYLTSGEWRETPDRVVPHLVVVVQSLGQLQRMRRAAADAVGALAEHPSPAGGPASEPATSARLCASITLANRLEEAGPLASIWWPLLPILSDAPLPARAATPSSEGRNPSLLSPRRIFP
ncbi:MAG TPA: replication-relaxation family protein, partial [Ktedonobacterales bacterium]|nr:replication-relaxation family protein [Ktedonobacterales bacterium]